MFWPIRVNDHQCTLVPIDEKKVWFEYLHSEDQAGYDVIEVTDDQFICPICKSRFTKGIAYRKRVGFKSYKDALSEIK